MGLGAFGGGEGVAAWLLEQDAIVTITDLRTESALARPLDRLDTDRCRLVLGMVVDCLVHLSLHIGVAVLVDDRH